MKTRYQYIIASFALMFLSVAGFRLTFDNHSQNIAMQPLLLDPARPQLRHVGGLEFLGAWELGSGNQDFGGISALTALDDGRFVGVSDAGTLIGFGLTNDDRIDRPFIVPLPDAFGKHRTYEDRDSESIAYDRISGKFWVGYEAKAAIRRFSRSFARVEAVARPEPMRHWLFNSGAEAMVRFPNGHFAVFSEGRVNPKNGNQALMFDGDPTESGTHYFTFNYMPPAGYRITDARQLPDGRLLTLNRRLGFPDGLSAIVAIFDPAEIKPGAMITPMPIATLKSPLLVDNMEGLAITQSQGRTLIWLISDNNFNFFQRTILMKFALSVGNKKPAAKIAPGFKSL